MGRKYAEMAGNRPVEIRRRLRRANAVAATSFLVGGSLFAIGAALAQAGVDATVCATVYLVGGVFFGTGGYTSVLQVVNEPEGGYDRNRRCPRPPRCGRHFIRIPEEMTTAGQVSAFWGRRTRRRPSP
jgi:hypothetical protein